LLTVSKFGTVKKTNIFEYQRINRNGKIALTLKDEDELIDALVVNKQEEIFIAASNSRMNRFDGEQLRPLSRTACGVQGIRLENGERVVSISSSEEGKYIFCMGTDGFG
ncbi:DNA gyrase C-terminal beta-propeller domain-containing protein, partial [Metamycoplasma equirhinis]